MEAQADVVGDPVAVGVAEDRLEKGDGAGEDGGAVGGVEQVEDSVAEGVEPGVHAVGKRSWARDDLNGLNGEASFFEQAAIDRGAGVEGGRCGFSVDVEGREGGLEGGADGGDVALSAHLRDEAAAGAEGAVDASEKGLLTGDSGDPVEGGVGEDGVELLVVREAGCALQLDVEIAQAGSGEHGGGAVHAEEDGSGGGELLGEGAVAAAEIEDGFAGLWGEEIDYRGGEVGYEAAVGGVGVGVPGLEDGRGRGLRAHRCYCSLPCGVSRGR